MILQVLLYSLVEGGSFYAEPRVLFIPTIIVCSVSLIIHLLGLTWQLTVSFILQRTDRHLAVKAFLFNFTSICLQCSALVSMYYIDGLFGVQDKRSALQISLAIGTFIALAKVFANYICREHANIL